MPYHPVDVHVGNRLRQRRILLGMTQATVGAAVGLTFQQVQKYERRADRITASRLLEFAKVLGVPVTHFFEGMPRNALATTSASRGKNSKEAGAPHERSKDPLFERETLELVRNYYKIGDSRVRRRIFEMVKALGAAGPRKGIAAPTRNGAVSGRRATREREPSR